MKLPRHVIADQTQAVTVAVLLWGAGLYLLWDAWEGRGRARPKILGLFTPL